MTHNVLIAVIGAAVLGSLAAGIEVRIRRRRKAVREAQKTLQRDATRRTLECPAPSCTCVIEHFGAKHGLALALLGHIQSCHPVWYRERFRFAAQDRLEITTVIRGLEHLNSNEVQS